MALEGHHGGERVQGWLGSEDALFQDLRVQIGHGCVFLIVETVMHDRRRRLWYIVCTSKEELKMGITDL
jgi:hypothetical protein